MKLKTLKELMPFGNINHPDNLIHIQKLRQEAIKWIEKFEEDKKRYEGFIRYGRFIQMESIDWIKLFFNIKEEEIL
jgi:hypothetical protein